jgi:hypothetical protein
MGTKCGEHPHSLRLTVPTRHTRCFSCMTARAWRLECSCVQPFNLRLYNRPLHSGQQIALVLSKASSCSSYGGSSSSMLGLMSKPSMPLIDGLAVARLMSDLPVCIIASSHVCVRLYPYCRGMIDRHRILQAQVQACKCKKPKQ